MQVHSEQSKFYWNLVLSLRKDKESGKTKMDYSLYELEKLENGEYKSTVSPEIVKTDYNFKRRTNSVYFQKVYCLNEGKFEEALKIVLPESEKFLRKKIPLRFKFKKFMRQRVEQILYEFL